MDMLSQNRYRFVTPWEEKAAVQELSVFGLGQFPFARGLRRGPARKAFLKWLRGRHPAVMRTIIKRARKAPGFPPVVKAADLWGTIKQTAADIIPGFPPVIRAAESLIGQLPTAEELEGLGQGFFADLWGTIKQTAADIIPAAIKSTAEQELIKRQMQRAQMGLPPVPIPPGTTPAPQTVPVPLVSPAMQQMMVPLAIGGGALLLFMMMQQRRR